MEHAEGSIVIEAPLEDVMEVIEDYESYPEWADVRTVDVRQRGEGNRATEVAFEVDVPVLGKAAYTLSYQYAPGDTGLSWVTTEARGAIRDIRGEYLLDELSESELESLRDPRNWVRPVVAVAAGGVATSALVLIELRRHRRSARGERALRGLSRLVRN